MMSKSFSVKGRMTLCASSSLIPKPKATMATATLVEGALEVAESAMDVEMEENLDMGYESCEPMQRRPSMSEEDQRQRRASIKAIMSDPGLSPMTKRRSIQHLMDGRRNSLASQLSVSSGNSVGSTASSHSSSPDMGYEDTDMDHHDGDHHEGHHQHCYIVSNDQTKRMEQTRPRCHHYERNCTLISPCCGAAFGCRICHDECPVLPPPFFQRRQQRSCSLPGSFTSMTIGHQEDEDGHHHIDRFAVAEVICRQCFTRQSSKTNNCVNCNVQFGRYHCNICNLWMTDEESPYHCHDCGFCRVGGAENFKHCNDCGMCIDIKLYNNHNCKDGKYKSNCPVCQEYLFSSRSASHEMPCGHAIHWECFRELAAHDSRCPVCKKTAETRERMLPTWMSMAANITNQPIPPELARVVNISCNDCEVSDHARAWHFLGVQCNNCQSFNTVVDSIMMTGIEAHEYLRLMSAKQMVYAASHGEQQDTQNGQRRVNRRQSLF